MRAERKHFLRYKEVAEPESSKTVEKTPDFRTKTLVILENFQFFQKNFYSFSHNELRATGHGKRADFSNQSCRYI